MRFGEAAPVMDGICQDLEAFLLKELNKIKNSHKSRESGSKLSIIMALQ